ncbi:MAG: (d)CMP kinase [archaeon]
MIITISGTAGSGKSTVASILARMLKYKHYSTGDFQRKLANKKGITIVELGELAKNDLSIDRLTDKMLIDLGKKSDNFVIDSWLSAHFIPHGFKVYLDADVKERARRITKKRQAESYTKTADAFNAIMQREKTNRDRFLKLYNYDFKDKKNYDLVIDTTHTNAEEVAQMIASGARERSEFRYFDHTADTMFEGYGKTLDEAFSNCALAMFNLLTDISQVKHVKTIKLSLKSDTIEKLLFDFLDELIFYLDTEHIIFSKIDLKIKKGKQITLDCTMKGDMASNYVTKGDIKAPTYNEMKIFKKDNKWVVRAVVDI